MGNRFGQYPGSQDANYDAAERHQQVGGQAMPCEGLDQVVWFTEVGFLHGFLRFFVFYTGVFTVIHNYNTLSV